jgi:hypothetical protein
VGWSRPTWQTPQADRAMPQASCSSPRIGVSGPNTILEKRMPGKGLKGAQPPGKLPSGERA